MHWCDEVNTRVWKAITRQSRIIWWSYRYGILSTPKTNPSADRVNKHPRKLTRGDECGKATIKTGYVAMHKRDTSKAQCKQVQDCSILLVLQYEYVCGLKLWYYCTSSLFLSLLFFFSSLFFFILFFFFSFFCTLFFCFTLYTMHT